MAHEIAKILLERTKTESDRVRAIQAALQMGMPLNEIEEYLDWIDMIRAMNREPSTNGGDENRKGV